jgi:hypothetical protein
MAIFFLLVPVFLIAFRNSAAMPAILRAPNHWSIKIVVMMIATIVCIIAAGVILLSCVPPPTVMN